MEDINIEMPEFNFVDTRNQSLNWIHHLIKKEIQEGVELIPTEMTYGSLEEKHDMQNKSARYAYLCFILQTIKEEKEAWLKHYKIREEK